MPTYQYECSACHESFEIMQSMLDKKLRKCPKCGKFKLARLIGTGGGIIFKGSGFYETDYKRKQEPVKKDKDAPSSATSTDASASKAKASEKPKESSKETTAK